MILRKKTNYIIVHHSVSPKNTTVEQITQWHKSRGFETIGYHYLVNESGIQNGRPEQYVGSHCSAQGRNYDSIGVCMAGNYEKELIDRDMRESLVNILKRICEKYNLKVDRIFAHKDFYSTACCGKNLYNELQNIKSEVERSLKYNNILKEINMTYDELKAELKKEFVIKDSRFHFDHKTGEVWIINYGKKYKLGTMEDDIQILGARMCGSGLTDEERKYPETKNRGDVLS